MKKQLLIMMIAMGASLYGAAADQAAFGKAIAGQLQDIKARGVPFRAPDAAKLAKAQEFAQQGKVDEAQSLISEVARPLWGLTYQNPKANERSEITVAEILGIAAKGENPFLKGPFSY